MQPGRRFLRDRAALARQAACCGVACALAWTTVAAAAAAEPGHHPAGDQERAREALEAGQVVPLQDILDKVAAEFSGKMIQVALQDADHGLLYEVTLLTEEGQVVALTYDARTATLLNGDLPAIAAARQR